MVPPSGTGYIQVLDSFYNKKIKDLIWEQEEVFYDIYEAEFKAGKFTVSDRQVLLST